MAELDRLSDSIEWIDLEFVERERTPREIIEKGIRYHLAGLSLSNTVTLLADLGVQRSRVAVHNWVQKADLQPADGECPDRVAVDQKAIQIYTEQYWLYAAVDPATNRVLHSRLFPTYTIPIAREFLAELAEKHDVTDAVFFVDDADDLIVDSVERATATASSNTASEIQSNVSLEREDGEPLRSQTVLATPIQQPLKRGYKPTPSGGIMSKVTRPSDHEQTIHLMDGEHIYRLNGFDPNGGEVWVEVTFKSKHGQETASLPSYELYVEDVSSGKV